VELSGGLPGWLAVLNEVADCLAGTAVVWRAVWLYGNKKSGELFIWRILTGVPAGWLAGWLAGLQ